ncbi:MAG: nuclear transport factor 2 family protein [Chloroflexota bacterium]
MPKITVQADCGNSPKKTFLRDWQVACVEGDPDFITDHITDDITFQSVGKATIKGRSAVLETISEMTSQAIAELVIHKIITHGREGAVNGEIHRENGEVLAFCNVYAFKSARGNALKAITAYVIQVP